MATANRFSCNPPLRKLALLIIVCIAVKGKKHGLAGGRLFNLQMVDLTIGKLFYQVLVLAYKFQDFLMVSG